MNNFTKIMRNLIVIIAYVSIFSVNAQTTSPEYIKGTDTLVVYTDVPNLAPFLISFFQYPSVKLIEILLLFNDQLSRNLLVCIV